MESSTTPLTGSAGLEASTLTSSTSWNGKGGANDSSSGSSSLASSAGVDDSTFEVAEEVMVGTHAPHEDHRVVEPMNSEASARHGYCRNNIRTTKYTWYNILPKNLFEQFHRFANVYFLFIVILNWIPSVQAFAREVSMLPLLAVLSVTFCKDLYEDRRRHRQDKEANGRESLTFSRETGTYEPKAWRDIEVGDIIKLESNDIVPADMLMLWSSHPEGLCFLETANIDGETNLKQRRVFHDQLEQQFNPQDFKSVVFCEHPNTKIYQFDGKTQFNGQTYPLDTNNMLLRGCVLRNTAQVVGMVMYAGHDTKAMLNNTGPRSKRSKVERNMNAQIIFCCIILVILCSVAAGLTNVWTAARDYFDVLYIADSEEPTLEGFTRFWTFFIIFQVMIPISLYVSIELVKLFQVYFIQQDVELYYEERDAPMACRALNITEDLGQIDFIFSDKTGTLTQNKMVFHRCSINGRDYAHTAKEDGKEFQDAFSFPLDPELSADIEKDAGEAGQGSSITHTFLLSLAACNTVIPNNDASTGEFLRFEAESPDEAALVSAAFRYDYKLVQRSNKNCVVQIKGKEVDYEVLNILPFDSTRKRMSVLIRLPDGRIRLLTKGADSAIYGVLRDSVSKSLKDATNNHMDIMARSGLRTLCYAYKDVDEGVYNEWDERYQKIEKSIAEDKKKNLKKLAMEMETDLLLLGATGIEDKLQDGVPESIETLREAGLKIWVLTGDKQETAIEIAYSCKLVTRDMDLVLVNSRRAHEKVPKNDKQHHQSVEADVHNIIQQQMRHVEETRRTTGKEVAIVIDGATLAYALHESLSLEFLELAVQSKVLVVCRATPLQKAQVVHLVKHNKNVMTLAIGDGANDVSMIQMAHVGVGVSGQEGMQAVMASDFAIGQFRFLVRLLLVHGHWCYDRLANLIIFFFFKNTLIVFSMVSFQIFCGFSGQTAIDQMYLQTINLLWTSLPPLASATFDQDASAAALMKNPILYEKGRKDQSYKGRFWPAILDSSWQCLCVFYIPLLAMRTDHSNGLIYFGFIHFMCLFFAIMYQWFNFTRLYNWTHWAFLAWSVLGVFAFSFIYHSLVLDSPLIPEPYFVSLNAVADGKFWLLLLLAPTLATAPRFFVILTTQWFNPTLTQFARERELLADRAQQSPSLWSKLCCMCTGMGSVLFPYEEPAVEHRTSASASSRARKPRSASDAWTPLNRVVSFTSDTDSVA